MDLWKEASDEETRQIIEKIAKTIVDREMDIPATMFIGTYRPVSYMGGQMLRFFIAAFTPLFGDLPYEYISVLEKSDNLKKLMKRIEELSEQRDLEKKKLKEEKKRLKDEKNKFK